jgi:glycerol-3-phosphate dehydrogenase
VYVLLGGKYTTFRRMTQELAKEIVPRLGKPYYPNLTLNPLRQKSLFPTFGPKPQVTLDLIKKVIQEERVTTLEDLLKRRLSVIKDLQSNDSIQGLSVNEIKNLF